MKGKENVFAFAENLKDERQTEPAGQKQFSHMETPKVSESKIKILPKWKLNPNCEISMINGIETFTINNRNPFVSNSWNQMDKNSNSRN